MVEIEIFSDIICPWCFIGKRRLDEVLATEIGAGVKLRWRPYQLYPNVDAAGVDRIALLKSRYGETADLGRVPGRIAAEGEEEGILFRYDLIERTPNTLKAHQLMELAYTQGVQHALAERLFEAYFCQGMDVGDHATLVDLATQVGLPSAAASDYLEADQALAEVQTQLARAPELGISGVPGYYLANAFLLPGAQTSEVMGQIITRVKDRLATRDQSA